MLLQANGQDPVDDYCVADVASDWVAPEGPSHVSFGALDKSFNWNPHQTKKNGGIKQPNTSAYVAATVLFGSLRKIGA